MTNLSPAAMAVLAAIEDHGTFSYRKLAAATLKAAAAQLPRSAMYPSCDWGSGWRNGIGDAEKKLLAIAAELEGPTT